MLLTKTFKKGQPVPWRFKPGSVATITWIEVVRLMERSPSCWPIGRTTHFFFSRAVVLRSVLGRGVPSHQDFCFLSLSATSSVPSGSYAVCLVSTFELSVCVI